MNQMGLDFATDVNRASGRTGGRTREGLPWSGRTAISRHRSSQAAQAAASTRVVKSLRYLEILEHAGAQGLSDHEAVGLTGYCLQTICSTRGRAMDAGLVLAGARVATSPYGRLITTWVHRWCAI